MRLQHEGKELILHVEPRKPRVQLEQQLREFVSL